MCFVSQHEWRCTLVECPDQEFRDQLPQLLVSFHQLITDSWSTRRELLQKVYGYGLEQLHPDCRAEETILANWKSDHALQNPVPS